MKKPNWQSKFRELPEIPNSKKWIAGENGTLEQKITLKLISNQTITAEEESLMLELTDFYKRLYKSLEKLEYNTFTKKDFEKFKNYILYAFNYVIFLTNNLTISQLYRVVINKNIIGSKTSLTKKGFLSYPPLHIVKKINKFNRANEPNATVFYGAESIDTALNEIKPQKGDLVSVGVWKPTRDGEFISYPISHSTNGFGVNDNSTSAMVAFIEYRKKQSKVLGDFLEHFFQLLGREYSKPINHHYEYLISAIFSNRILDNPQNKGTNFDIECIVYPSVGNKFLTSNLAVRRDVFRHNFELTKVIEFEVSETHYDKSQKKDPGSINLVDFINYKETEKFEDNIILWE